MFELGNENVEKKFDIIEILKKQKKLKDELKVIRISHNLALPNEKPPKKILILDSDPDRLKSPNRT